MEIQRPYRICSCDPKLFGNKIVYGPEEINVTEGEPWVPSEEWTNFLRGQLGKKEAYFSDARRYKGDVHYEYPPSMMMIVEELYNPGRVMWLFVEILTDEQ